MPTTTPLMKVDRTKSYGAEVVLHGDVYDESAAYAAKLAEEKGYTFIHPFRRSGSSHGAGNYSHGDNQRTSSGGLYPWFP